jgi:hypothetical protein
MDHLELGERNLKVPAVKFAFEVGKDDEAVHGAKRPPHDGQAELPRQARKVESERDVRTRPTALAEKLGPARYERVMREDEVELVSHRTGCELPARPIAGETGPLDKSFGRAVRRR